MWTVIVCTAIATSSVWFVITAILVSSVRDKHVVIVKKRAGDMVSFKTSSGLVKTAVLSVDWLPSDKYVIVEGIKSNYVPYVVRAENVLN